MSENLIVIMSDEHNSKFLGSRGHPYVKTPNLDRLASMGTMFTNAYTPSPVCVPARASFATGRYVHDIEKWDNAAPFAGDIPSWHSILRDRGHQVVSVGKLHFRSSDDDNGFSEEVIGMHVVDAQGDLLGLIRDEDMAKRNSSSKMARMAGPGESSYTTYDRDITARSQIWLREEAPKHTDKPWVLFVSLVAPHFPLTAPPEHYYAYYNEDLPLPKNYASRANTQHPYIEDYRSTFAYDEFFETPDRVKMAQAAYMGLCSFLDENIGKILTTVDECGLGDNTRIVYTSDHGDNVGARGLWGKSTMYDESVAVPLIMSGPGIDANKTVDTPATLLDIYPYIFETVGQDYKENVTRSLPGQSLIELMNGGHVDRSVFSEYHAMGSKSAAYMVRKGRYKLVFYSDYNPQLFDLEDDPEELRDIAQDPSSKHILETLIGELNKICDPFETDKRAKQCQADMVEKVGGRQFVIDRGDLGFSVPPGVAPSFD